MRALALLLLILPVSLTRAAEVVDKVAVIVEAKAITDRQIREEIRYSAFLNGEQPDMGLDARKQAASRLVDQVVIRSEMEVGLYPQSIPADAAQMLAGLKKRYASEAVFRQEMAKQGIDQQELTRRLEWQAAVLAFVGRRFATAQVAGADRDAINETFFGWLDTMRKQTRIVYREPELKPADADSPEDDDQERTPLPSNRPRRRAQ